MKAICRENTTSTRPIRSISIFCSSSIFFMGSLWRSVNGLNSNVKASPIDSNDYIVFSYTFNTIIDCRRVCVRISMVAFRVAQYDRIVQYVFYPGLSP